MSKKKPHFVRRLSVFLGVLAASKLKVSRHKKKILAGRLGLDPLFVIAMIGALAPQHLSRCNDVKHFDGAPGAIAVALAI